MGLRRVGGSLCDPRRYAGGHPSNEAIVKRWLRCVPRWDGAARRFRAVASGQYTHEPTARDVATGSCCYEIEDAPRRTDARAALLQFVHPAADRERIAEDAQLLMRPLLAIWLLSEQNCSCLERLGTPIPSRHSLRRRHTISKDHELPHYAGHTSLGSPAQPIITASHLDATRQNMSRTKTHLCVLGDLQ